MKKIYLWGYWAHNFGDDLFLKVYLDKIQKYHVKTYLLTKKKFKSYYEKMGFEVICADSIQYRMMYKILTALDRPELFYSLVRKSDWFVMLGGSLFAENKGKHAEKLQLKNLNYAVNRAEKSFVIGSNFGPYKSPFFLKNYTELFKHTDDVCFRDRKSLSLFCDSLGNVRFSPDVVFEGVWHQQPLLYENKVVISAIDLRNRCDLIQYCETYEQALSDLCIKHIKNGDQIVLLSLCENEGDTSACNRIQKMVEEDVGKSVDIIEYNTIDEVLGLIEGAQKVYATRFHALMTSLYFKKKVVSIPYNDKSINAANSYNIECPSFPIWAFDTQTAEKMFECSVVPKMQLADTNQFKKFEEAARANLQ